MEKLGVGEEVTKDFFGRQFHISRPNQWAVEARSNGFWKVISISGNTMLTTKEDFYPKPYFVNLKEGFKLSNNSALKFFLEIPLMVKLVVSSGKKEIEIENHQSVKKQALYGPVSGGTLCTFIDPRATFDVPRKSPKSAVVPVRILNKTGEAQEIKKFYFDPRHMSLWAGDMGNFTNKIYISVLSGDEFRITYGKATTDQAGRLEKVIEQQLEVRSMITKFSPFGIAREMGL